MALQPFDDRRRARTDPFSMMDAMMEDMMQPFGSRRGGRGGGFGGGFGGFGGMFDDMDQMMMQGGGGSQMMISSSSGMGGGTFSCQTMSFSSRMGSDGQMHTEQFSSSTVGDSQRGFRETQQAYSNSSTGMDKMSMERQLGEQGRKMVKERSRASGEERQTEMFRGITEEQAGAFDARWREEAAPHIPQHRPGQMRAALGYGGGYGGQAADGYRVPQQAALPAPGYGYTSSHRNSAPAASGGRVVNASSMANNPVGLSGGYGYQYGR